MKIVKVEIEDELHSKFKTWAFSSGVTMSGALKEWIGDKCSPVDLKVGKVVLAPVKSAPPIPENTPVVLELKEGFGWCRVCGKNMVKLPHFLCSTCQKL